jgi:hypothetical protein
MKRPNVIPNKPTNIRVGEVPKKNEEKEQEVFTPNLALQTPDVKIDDSYKEHNVDEAVKAYEHSLNESGMNAIKVMQERTRLQLEARNRQLEMNKVQTKNYQTQMEQAEKRHLQQEEVIEKPITRAEIKLPVNTTNIRNVSMNTPELNYPRNLNYIEELSQPQFNSAFDMIPLPSEGKLYNLKKKTVKVAYMTTADENILTSPNLLQSGQFLEILINRKLLEPNLRYKDLHVGDRSAIMLWLRATSYGEMYPVTLLDENNVPFETQIDLTSLKTKPLGDTPDEEGLFNFYFPVAKVNIKYRLLNIGDLEEIELLLEEDKKAGDPVNHNNTYVLERQIVEIDGNRDEKYIDEFVRNLRIKDNSLFKKHVENIESGVDLELEIKTPGGGSVKTFFPLNISFFWPDLTV